MLSRINRIHIYQKVVYLLTLTSKAFLEFSITNEQLNPLLCSIVRGLFNKARVGALTFFGFPKIEYLKVGKDPPLFQSE